MSNSRCEYLKQCRTADVWRNHTLSYWPRPPELAPYCNGVMDNEKCAIYSYLREHPEEVGELRRGSGYKIRGLLGAPICLGFGLYNLLSSAGTHGSLSRPIGVIELLLAGTLIADGMTEVFAKKHIIKYIREFRDRNGSDEIYDRIYNGCEDIGNESDYFWEEDINKEELFGEVLGDNFDMKNLGFTVFDIKGMRTGATNFRLGKMRVSYHLTDDFDIPVDRDVGVVLTTSYDRDSVVDEKARDLFPDKLYFSQGLIFPVISGRDFKRGAGFANCTKPLSTVEKFLVEEIGTEQKIDIEPEEWFDSGDMYEVFRDSGISERAAREMLPRKAQEDAIRVQRVIQEAIASDY